MVHQDITVLFVPGAHSLPDCFDELIPYLSEAGYNIAKTWLPSTLINGASPIANFDPDVAEIRKKLSSLIDQSQKVILVAHSYGGQCGSEAAAGFDQASLTTKGHTDGRGIIHFVYLAAFMLRKGESLRNTNPGTGIIRKKLGNGSYVPANPEEALYNDFTSKDRVNQWKANLHPWSPSVIFSELSYEPWRKIPTTYLACKLDNAIPFESQKRFVKNVQEAGALKLRSLEWNTGHTPFGVRPVEVSNLIRSVVEDIPVLDETSVSAQKSKL